VLEFSQVAAPLRKAYDLYSFSVLPRLGQLVAGDADSYRYLAESIRMHPGQAELKALMKVNGFGRGLPQPDRGGGGAACRRQMWLTRLPWGPARAKTRTACGFSGMICFRSIPSI
jgi:hypothetical protein